MTTAHRTKLVTLLVATSTAMTLTALPASAAEPETSSPTSTTTPHRDAGDTDAGAGDHNSSDSSQSTAADTSTTPSDTTQPDSTPETAETAPTAAQRAEYSRLRKGLLDRVNKAQKQINELYPEARKLRDDKGYDAAFEAVARLDEASVIVGQITDLVNETDDNPTKANTDKLLQARRLTPTLGQKLEYAVYDIDLAKKIGTADEKKAFECKNAIDEGDETGSSVGSSTRGLLNIIGNRIVYDEDGRPSCKTNFQFFSSKFLKFFSTVMTIVSFVGTVMKLFSPAQASQ